MTKTGNTTQYSFSKDKWCNADELEFGFEESVYLKKFQYTSTNSKIFNRIDHQRFLKKLRCHKIKHWGWEQPDKGWCAYSSQKVSLKSCTMGLLWLKCTLVGAETQTHSGLLLPSPHL